MCTTIQRRPWLDGIDPRRQRHTFRSSRLQNGERQMRGKLIARHQKFDCYVGRTNSKPF